MEGILCPVKRSMSRQEEYHIQAKGIYAIAEISHPRKRNIILGGRNFTFRQEEYYLGWEEYHLQARRIPSESGRISFSGKTNIISMQREYKQGWGNIRSNQEKYHMRWEEYHILAKGISSIVGGIS